MPRPFCSPPSSSDASASPLGSSSASGHPASAAATGTAAAAGDASGPAGFLQQLHLRMRTHCCGGNAVANAGETGCADSGREVAASVNAVGLALPCLLQSWRRRIECMAPDSPEQRKPADRTRHDQHRHQHQHHHSHHRPERSHRRRRGDRSVERPSDASLSPPASTASSVSSASTISSSSVSSHGDDSEVSSPPPPPALCRMGMFELPKLLHPRLERQRACASLSGLWSAISPPSSPDADASVSRLWPARRHPYWRSGDDFSSSSSSK